MKISKLMHKIFVSPIVVYILSMKLYLFDRLNLFETVGISIRPNLRAYLIIFTVNLRIEKLASYVNHLVCTTIGSISVEESEGQQVWSTSLHKVTNNSSCVAVGVADLLLLVVGRRSK